MTAIWRNVVSMGRVSDASRALRTFSAQVFWNENLFPRVIAQLSFQL